MAGMIGVSIKGMKDLEQRLGKLRSSEAYQAGVMKVAKEIRTRAQMYPPVNRPTRKSVYGNTWQSDKQRRCDKQRRWFFANLKSGEIKVPYKRTGKLRRGWKVERFGSDDAIVYNEVSYGAYVMERASQSKYMMAVPWKTQEDIMDKLIEDKAARIMAQEVDRLLAG